MQADLSGKRVELLKQTVARLTRVAVLWNPANQLGPKMLDATVTAAQALGLQVQRTPTRGLEDYDSAFMVIVRERADALIVLGDLTFWFHRARINELASRHRLPTMYATREQVESGGLMCYGPETSEAYRAAATYVHRILAGATPRRSSDRAGDHVRAGHQLEDRQGARSHHPAHGPATGDRAHPVVDRRALIVGTLGLLARRAARRRDADGGEDVSSRPRDLGNPRPERRDLAGARGRRRSPLRRSRREGSACSTCDSESRGAGSESHRPIARISPTWRTGREMTGKQAPRKAARQIRGRRAQVSRAPAPRVLAIGEFHGHSVRPTIAL